MFLLNEVFYTSHVLVGPLLHVKIPMPSLLMYMHLSGLAMQQIYCEGSTGTGEIGRQICFLVKVPLQYRNLPYKSVNGRYHPFLWHTIEA